jgi:NhaP-type Na+/H+ or K+/H+ antiporter
MTVIPLDDVLVLAGLAAAFGLLIGYALCLATEHVLSRRIDRHIHKGPRA